MIQIGLRAHDYGRLPPQQLADIIADYHPESIQLALTKALNPAPSPGALSPGYARHIRRVFEARSISIAVLGCYINPIHPDPDEREKALASFGEHLRYARDFGCALVGTETGSLNANCSFHPDTQKDSTFDLFCKSAERLLNCAEKCGSIVAIEPVAYQHTVSSIEKTLKLIERFPTPALGIIWDPVNLIPIDGLHESQQSFFERTLDAFGSRIAAIHAKDFRMENGRKKGDLPAGTGELDWPALLQLLAERKPGIDILLENTDPASARTTMAFLRETSEKISAERISAEKISIA
ncbi:MAG: sugar phosphate isomerase/epimerase [Treponema sp.]|nr:sugar phosphate isomerase/epimerase [Treponema sp.]